MRVSHSSSRKPSARPTSPGANSTTAAPLRLQSKAHQLAEHIRQLIERGELTGPLPASRVWSQQLGVSRRTLDATLHALRAQGLLEITRRGAALADPVVVPRRLKQRPAARVVRALIFAGYQRQSFIETFGVLQERLRPRGVTVRWELSGPARLREMAARPTSQQELIVLASVPSEFQRLFAQKGRAVIVLGEVGPDIALPFVNVDQAGVVRHAVIQLLQHGVRQLHFVHARLDSVGIATAVTAFQSACREWTKEAVTATVHPTRLDRTALLATSRKLARGASDEQERRGVVVLAPVPLPLIATALLHHGWVIPQQVELAGLFHPTEAAALYSPFTHYRFPAKRVIHHLTLAAEAYFQSGERPVMKKTLLADMERVD